MKDPDQNSRGSKGVDESLGCAPEKYAGFKSDERQNDLQVKGSLRGTSG